jgi:hypothetical protein
MLRISDEKRLTHRYAELLRMKVDSALDWANPEYYGH